MKKFFRITIIFSLLFLLLTCIACKKEEEPIPVNHKDLAAIYEALFKDVDLNNVTSDLDFKAEVDGVTITYNSSNIDIITNDGKVTRPRTNTTVDVQVSLAYEDDKYENSISFTVLGKEDKLKDALDNFKKSQNNYNLKAKMKLDGELAVDVDYSIDNDKIRVVDKYNYLGASSISIFYLVYKNGKIIEGYFIESSYKKITSADQIEESLYNTDYEYDNYNFDFDSQDFIFENGKYVLKEEKLSTVGKKALGSLPGEVFNSFYIEIKNNNLYKIVATSTYTDDETYEIEYELTFSNFGNQSVGIPGASSYIDISDIYSYEDGSEIEVHAVVMGYSGNSYYLDDKKGTVRVDFASSEVIPEGLDLGCYAKVRGTLKIEDGLYIIYVDNKENVTYNDGMLLGKTDYNDLSALVTANYSQVFDLINVKVSNNVASLDNDTLIEVSDSLGNKLNLLVLKEEASFFNEAFKEIDASRLLTISNVTLGVNSDRLVLRLTEQVEAAFVKGLIASPLSLTLEKGVTRNQILEMISIEYYDEEKTALSFEDVDVSFDFEEGKPGVYELVITYLDCEVTIKVLIYSNGLEENVSYDVLTDETYKQLGYKPGLPSTGDVNILVIPIKFNNSDDYDLSIIEKAFNGTNEDTGWYSLTSYYQEVSFGKLNLHATITAPYETGVNYDLKNGYSGLTEYAYLEGAIAYFDEEIDYSLYDQNNDGYIDCVYLLYLAPYRESSDLWWAFSYEYFSEDDPKFDGVGMDWYIWISYEFFNKPIYQGGTSDSWVYVDINCETLIHETGHGLGLDDYYDLDTKRGPNGGMGGFTMMDYNHGDHDPFSKAILGWINPTVVSTNDCTYTIGSFTEAGDAFFIMKQNCGSYFSEYYIISLYNPTKVNAIKSDKGYGLPSINGVAIFHVDAITSDHLNDSSIVLDIYQYNNSNTDHKLISLVEADGNNDIELKNGLFNESDLFLTGDSIGLSWYGEDEVAFTITFTNVSKDEATFVVTFNEEANE